jgi:hypothetical protein
MGFASERTSKGACPLTSVAERQESVIQKYLNPSLAPSP